MISRSLFVFSVGIALTMTGCPRSPSPGGDVRSSAPVTTPTVPAASAAPVHVATSAEATATSSPASPRLPIPRGPSLHRLCVGGGHTCFVDEGHTLWCWGANTYGQVGIGTHGFGGRTEDTDFEHAVVKQPTRVAALRGQVRAVECGSQATCALSLDGSVSCWGNRENPKRLELFADTPMHRDIGGKAVALALKEEHACAVREDHTLWCWGANSAGQLGPGAPVPGLDYAPAVEVKGLGANVRNVVVLRDATCALKDDGTLWCWGDNHEGQLGDGTYEKRPEPTRAVAPERFRLVSAAAFHVCGVTVDDRLVCWGRNYEGQLGNGQTPSTKPVRYATAQNLMKRLTGVRALALGYSSTLAALDNGELYGWGDLTLGMRGFKSSPHATAQKITMPAAVVDIAAHDVHRCALLSDDSVWCWGKGDDYELGNGRSDDHDAPVRVVFPK